MILFDPVQINTFVAPLDHHDDDYNLCDDHHHSYQASLSLSRTPSLPVRSNTFSQDISLSENQ